MAQRRFPRPGPADPARVYLDGLGGVPRRDAALGGGAGDTGPERSRSDCRRRVTPGPVRRARCAPSPRTLRRARGLSPRGGFPDRGFLIGLGGSLCSSVGIKLNIWTLSLSLFFFFFLRRSLRQNQEADDPYLLVDWKKDEENRKLPLR